MAKPLEALIAEAQGALASGDGFRAHKAFAKAARADPSSFEAHFGMASAAYQMATGAFWRELSERGVDIAELLPTELQGDRAISLEAAEHVRATSREGRNGGERVRRGLASEDYALARVTARNVFTGFQPTDSAQRAVALRPESADAQTLLFWVNDLLAHPTSKAPGGCFIATACYGSYDHPDVLVLRRYRDERLLMTPLGRGLVSLYYAVSPPLARWLSGTALASAIRRTLLEPMVRWLGRQSGHRGR